MEATLPAFGVTFAKPFQHKMGYSKPSKIVKFRTFHMSVFVNMTNMVVNSDVDPYMCMEVIICHLQLS